MVRESAGPLSAVDERGGGRAARVRVLVSEVKATGGMPLDAAASLRPGGMTTRIVHGGLWSLGGLVVTLVGSVVATPFTIRLFGSEAYGVWALMQVIMGYVAVADLGMGMASTRFGGQAFAHGDGDREIAIVWTSMIVGACPLLLVSLILGMEARPLVERVLQVPLYLQAETIIALRLVAIAGVVRALIGVLNTPQVTRLCLGLYTGINTAGVIIQLCLIPVTLALGGGLVAAGAVLAAVNVGLMMVHGIVSMRLVSGSVRPRVQLSLVRPLCRFGCGILIVTVSGTILVSAEKLLLTHFWSPTALAHYWVAHSMSRLIVAAPEAMGYSLLPAFSQLQGASAYESLIQLYTRALRGTILALAPSIAVICLWAEPFLTLWAGPEYGSASTVPFCILIGGLACHVMALVPGNILIAAGRTNVIARYQLVELVPYLVVAAISTAWLGGVGAALASSSMMVCNSFLVFRASRRIVHPAFTPFPGKELDYSVALAFLGTPILTAIMSRSLGLLALATVLGVSGYGWLVWQRVLTRVERDWILGAVREL